MKVATLTDANVFLLVDAVEGRRFAGKRHLVDAYLGGTLGPVGTDVEMELDPSVTALRRRPVNGSSPGGPRPAAPFRNFFPGFRSNGIGGGSSGDRNQAMKRPMPPSFPSSKDAVAAAAGAKRVRPTPGPSTSSSSKTTPAANGVDAEPVIEARVVSTTAASSSSSPSQSSSKDDEAGSSSNQEATKSLEEDVKAEADVKPLLDIRCFNDDERNHLHADASTVDDAPTDGDSDIEELAEISGISGFDEGVAVGDGGGGLRTEELSLSLFDDSPVNSTSAAAGININSAEFHADFDILAFMQANPKAAALRADFDMTVLDKASVTHKLLTSLLYDISKASAANAPVKDKKSEVSRAYFNYVFENVWESFPNFEGLMSMGAKVRDGGKDKNIKYFMRHKMQKWYGAMMDKMLGAEQPQVAGALQWQ